MPRPEVMHHMLAGSNVGLIARRQMLPSQPCNYFGISKYLTSDGVIRSDNHGAESLFPLYLYPRKGDMWDEAMPTLAPGGRRPNLTLGFTNDFANRLNMTWIEDGRGNRYQTFGPEDVFSYLYAVFHSLAYRERYAEFLKIDFPRLPLTSNTDLFLGLCTLGDELVRLHLLEGNIEPITSYPIKGTNLVEQVRYTEPVPDAEPGRVYINAQQYFEGVAPTVWSFQIGAYQVCQKWLKDRKGRTLSYDELTHYQQIVAVLARTIELMEQIDATIEEHGGWPLDGASREAVPVSEGKRSADEG